MINEAQARALVEERIAGLGDDAHGPWTPVITLIERFERGWIVYYGAAESGASLAGNAPFLVDEASGAVVVTGTAHPVEHYVANYLHPGGRHLD